MFENRPPPDLHENSCIIRAFSSFTQMIIFFFTYDYESYPPLKLFIPIQCLINRNNVFFQSLTYILTNLFKEKTILTRSFY